MSVVTLGDTPDISLEDKQDIQAIAAMRGIFECDGVVSNSLSYSLEVERYYE